MKNNQSLSRSCRSLTMLLALALALVSVPAFAEEGLPYFIAWEGIPGSGGYILEVKGRTGAVVHRENFSPATTEADLELDSGRYSFRIITLNKLKREANATPWKAFTVPAMTSPSIKAVTEPVIEPETPVILTVQAESLAIKAKAWLVSPSGREVPLKIRKVKKGTFELSAPKLEEEGEYTLSISNPPGKLATKAITLTTSATVEARKAEEKLAEEKRLAKLEADKAAALAEAQAAEASRLAKLEADQKAAAEKAQAERLAKQEEQKAALATAAESERLAKVEAERKASDERMAIEAEAATKAEAARLVQLEADRTEKARVEAERASAKAAARAEALKKRHYLDTGGGLNLNLLFGDWKSIYDNPSYGGLLFADYYLTRGLERAQGHHFDYALGCRLDFASRYNDGSSVYIESTLRTLTAALYPAVTFSMPRFRVKAWAGGGCALTWLKSASGDYASMESSLSLDPVYAGGLAVEVPVWRHLAIGLCGDYQYLDNATPITTVSASITVSWMYGPRP